MQPSRLGRFSDPAAQSGTCFDQGSRIKLYASGICAIEPLHL